MPTRARHPAGLFIGGQYDVGNYLGRAGLSSVCARSHAELPRHPHDRRRTLDPQEAPEETNRLLLDLPALRRELHLRHEPETVDHLTRSPGGFRLPRRDVVCADGHDQLAGMAASSFTSVSATRRWYRSCKTTTTWPKLRDLPAAGGSYVEGAMTRLSGACRKEGTPFVGVFWSELSMVWRSQYGVGWIAACVRSGGVKWHEKRKTKTRCA